MYCFMH